MNGERIGKTQASGAGGRDPDRQRRVPLLRRCRARQLAPGRTRGPCPSRSGVRPPGGSARRGGPAALRHDARNPGDRAGAPRYAAFAGGRAARPRCCSAAGTFKGRRLPIKVPVVNIGRGDYNDIVIARPQRQHHARQAPAPGGDLDSDRSRLHQRHLRGGGAAHRRDAAQPGHDPPVRGRDCACSSRSTTRFLAGRAGSTRS